MDYWILISYIMIVYRLTYSESAPSKAVRRNSAAPPCIAPMDCRAVGWAELAKPIIRE